ncbi:ATP-binding cassette domain-containing protein [Texcoconibacillus texcoconensis]|uniref:ABC-2 type transport system ATP-binding protein n=1 Tax=Texcoconibacillus texcoconensis TaxID=1095777 RepID=A0A840QPP2_9BACI|nr:ABC transporter ATP-binding protein [Texcoconibacillus texcoconensis]MBB5173301.1 ABC-2 type transport system ATP-binding protein [Texcoconibacillus texcoconensis]
MTVVRCENVSKVYGNKNGTQALTGLSVNIKENAITGVIGRNGAGKTTFLKTVAGFLRPTQGTVKVFAENPFHHIKVAENTVFIDGTMMFPPTLTLKDILQEAGRFYKNWDVQLAEKLFSYFALPCDKYHHQLSKGMKSTFHMIIGICARSPLTIFDEPTEGMDSAVRKDFYRTLLKDYLAHPRTILLSSHHLNEIEDLLEEIFIIHQGENRLHLPVDEVKNYAIGLTGEKKVIERICKNREVLYKREISHQYIYVVVKNDLSNGERVQVEGDGVKISAVSTEDVFIYLTQQKEGGIDDVLERS